MMTSSSSDDGMWLRRFHPAEHGAPRLVCFPHAGGSASFFLPVSKALSPAIDVLAVQYPGRQDRRLEQAITSIPDLVDQIFQALKSQVDRPLTLFGHSMGAIVAFEVARRLERETDAGATMLFVSGRRAPSQYRDDNVHLRDDDGIISELRRMSGTDAKLLGDDEILRMILPAVRNDYAAIEAYRCQPGAAVACPITGLTGDADPNTSLEEAGAWSSHTTGSFELHVFSGGHFFLVNHQAAITNLIRAHLISAVGGGPR